MSNQVNPNIYKYIALGALAVYVYKVAQKNGGTLQGNPEGVKPINADKVIDSAVPWVTDNPMIREILKRGAKTFINGLNGSEAIKWRAGGS